MMFDIHFVSLFLIPSMNMSLIYHGGPIIPCCLLIYPREVIAYDGENWPA